MALGRREPASEQEKLFAEARKVFSRAVALAERVSDYGPAAIDAAELIPPGVKPLVDLFQAAAERRFAERQTVNAIEQGERERAAADRRKAIARFAGTGDPEFLEGLVDHEVTEAKRQRAIRVERHAAPIAKIVEDFRNRRHSLAYTRRALRNYEHMWLDAPGDVLAAARAEIDTLTAAAA